MHNLLKLVETNMMSLPVKEFNQFVRGHLFVLTDYLLTNWMGKKESQKVDSELIVNFCATLTKFICKWLSLFHKNYTFV